jgi:hypothetical protein
MRPEAMTDDLAELATQRNGFTAGDRPPRPVRYRLTTSRAIAVYLVLMALLLCLAEILYFNFSFPRRLTSAATTELINRVRWYQAHAGDYNLIFIGDSRTYTDVHPELLDPLLGSSSINLSTFSDWFPTQLPMVQDLAPSIPRGTTVVWSIGTQNFVDSIGVQRVYPVGIANSLRFLSWGLPSTGLLDNIAYYNPALYFFARRGNLRLGILNFLDRPLTLNGAAEPAPADDAVGQLKKSYLADPRVARVDEVVDGANITSLVVYFLRGSYLRVELDQAYFRRKQQELSASLAEAIPEMRPHYWRMFEEILRIFKQNGVRLIVNEFEDAPFIYGSTEHRELFRAFMRETVASRVREEGAAYVRVDFDKLDDGDYFDWNHLNSKGVKTFIPMLAEQLRSHLSKN